MKRRERQRPINLGLLLTLVFAILAAMRAAILAISLLAACGGGEEVKVEQTPPQHQWIKVCNEGQFFCTLTWGECSPNDATCTACDPVKSLSQC